MAKLCHRLIPLLLALVFTLSAVSLLAPPASAASVPPQGTGSGVMTPTKASPQQGPVLTGGGSGDFPTDCHWEYSPPKYVTNKISWAINLVCSWAVYKSGWIWGIPACLAVGEVVSYVPPEAYYACT